MKSFFLIGLLFIITASCEKDNMVETQPIINGIWIETVHKSDTLVFENEYSSFILKRGTEIGATGRYGYRMERNSISLKWSLSSYSGWDINYYFDYNEEKEQIKIGNFFVDSLNKNETLTFLKIK